MKTVVFGDAHGCLQQILDLMDKIGPATDDRIISLGDFVDRGPDSPGCLEFVKKHESTMGNHEYKHVRFRQGILKNLSPSQIGTRDQFISRGLDYDAAVSFMETLPFFMNLPEAILVHAGLEPFIPLELQNPIVLVGGMSKREICGIDKVTGLPHWCAWHPKDAKPILFGHLRIEGDIPLNGNLFPLDTGCCAGGKLTAVTLPDFRIYSVPGRQKK